MSATDPGTDTEAQMSSRKGRRYKMEEGNGREENGEPGDFCIQVYCSRGGGRTAAQRHGCHTVKLDGMAAMCRKFSEVCRFGLGELQRPSIFDRLVLTKLKHKSSFGLKESCRSNNDL